MPLSVQPQINVLILWERWMIMAYEIQMMCSVSFQAASRRGGKKHCSSSAPKTPPSITTTSTSSQSRRICHVPAFSACWSGLIQTLAQIGSACSASLCYYSDEERPRQAQGRERIKEEQKRHFFELLNFFHSSFISFEKGWFVWINGFYLQCAQIKCSTVAAEIYF